MDSTKLPRVGIIGPGGIGRTHIAAWKANGIGPVACADAVPRAVEATVAKHGGEGFCDGSDLIRSGDVDIVSVCTPPRFHRELAVAATEACSAVIPSRFATQSAAWGSDRAEGSLLWQDS